MLSKPAGSFLVLLPVLVFAQLQLPAFGPQAAAAQVQLAQRSAFPPRPAMPFKSPVMRRLLEGKRHHHVTDTHGLPGQLTSPFLTTPPIYAAGSNPFDVALGHFNCDGKEDVIVAADPPVILLGNGDGTFQAATPIGTIGSAPTGVAVGDFNRDGNLDVVFAISGGAVVYLGKGNGTFSAGTTFSSRGTNQNVFARVLVADVNNDKIPDLILNTDAGLSVLLGNGNGTFQTPKLSSGSVQFMSTGDFNKDGNVDLAVTNGYNSLNIMLGNGAGTFAVTSSYSPAAHAFDAIAVADYNQDGFADVALPNGQVFLGNGDGTLRAPSAFPTAPDATVVAAVDLNGDGITDLLTVSSPIVRLTCGQSDFGTTGVSLGNGDGTFQPVTLFDSGGCSNPEVFGYTAFVAVGDLNNDGVPDLIVLSGISDYFSTTPELSVLINARNGTFPAARLDISDGSGAVAVNDFNHDGNPDVVLADGSVYLGNGDGTLRFLASASLGGIAVATGDFNHDGNPDLAAAVECAPAGCSSGGQLLIASGNGDGTFQTPTVLPSGGFYAEALALADFNNDGNLDVAVMNNCKDSSCGTGGSVSIYLGSGNGTFSLLNTISLTSGNSTSVVAGDFNNDGVVDLAVGFLTIDGPSVADIFLGNGDGSFQSPIVSKTRDGVTAAAVGDFNNDGILDLVLAEWKDPDSPGTGAILYGNGDGTFTAGPETVTAGPPFSVVAADFYGTGTLIPILADQCASVLDCPAGSVTLANDIMLLFLAVGDFNNDGKPDLVGSLQYDAGASVLLNIAATAAATTTTISPSAPQFYSAFQPVTFTAKVQHTGRGTPTGTVAFPDRGVSIGSASVDSSGIASITTTELAVGSHFVVAAYQGDYNFATSNSLGVRVTINKANTSTRLTSSQTPSEYGQKVIFTSIVTGQYGGTPTGTITFSDGSTTLGTSPLNGGTAKFSTVNLAVGFHCITATYSGNTNFAASTSPALNQVVHRANTATNLVSSVNPSTVGQSVTFIATVVPQYSGTPTGSIMFKNGATTIGKVGLRSGRANFTRVFKSAGTKPITASYSGDANFLTSSRELTQRISQRLLP
jgi:hypothetical protein